ncbi:MAG: TlyA family RNA methyltransferase [Acidobacteriaceae bacterium]|nr:TlyA family RNA methyltransferase [Acidobacteriaceae bacterium]
MVESREKAAALILAGVVRVNGQKADKPGRMVEADAPVEIEQALKYVSRGGLKLEAALLGFHVDVRGKVCMDVGTSTGGFTDCLLQNGALRVHAVDTGAGQIDWKLRNDERVVLHERCNARYLTFADIGEIVDVLVCDVSFISVTLLIPALAPLLKPEGDWIILVKPQFEVGRELVGKGGIVRDPAAHRSACEKVASTLADFGFGSSLMDSPISGAEGNREFLLHARHRLPYLLNPDDK